MKNKCAISFLSVLFLFVASCSSAVTATPTQTSTVTKTATLTPSPTLTPTFTPTFTPTLTSTPTPLSEPDAKAMIAWKDLGLSSEFQAWAPSNMGVEEGANAFTLSNGKSYRIAGSFVFANGKNPTQVVFGYTIQLPTQGDRQAFGLVIDQIRDFGGLGLSTLEGANDIGDYSKGATGNSGSWHWTNIAFRIDNIGAIVFVQIKTNVASEIDGLKVARVYAKSIEQPIPYCAIVSVKAVQTTDIPAFEVEAEGFYPQEGRYIKLDGPVLIGNEIKTATNAKLGLTGETFDQDGHISDVISFLTLEQLAEQGYQNAQIPKGPTEFTLIVGGHFSGCEATQTVIWP